MSDDDNYFTIGYFGPPALRKDYERQVAPPVGQPCEHCGDAIEADDSGTIDRTGRVVHHECTMRSIVGSVGHQKKLCSCFGGTEEDPPGMSRHDAAKAALALFMSTKARPQ